MPDKGLVAFFDILGYQNIIDNNEIDSVSTLISGTLRKLPEILRKEARSLFKEEVVQDFVDKQYLSKINVRLISDSILASFCVSDPKDTADDEPMLMWWIFLKYCSLLARQMFALGVPVRGAIDHGMFYLDEQCFAGKPIINCYRLSQQLNLSGVVLVDTTYEKYLELLKADNVPLADYNWNPGMHCLIPLKGGEDTRLYTLDWWNHESTDDVRQQIFEAFHAHQKDIRQDALSKLENTEMTARAFVLRKHANDRHDKRQK